MRLRFVEALAGNDDAEAKTEQVKPEKLLASAGHTMLSDPMFAQALYLTVQKAAAEAGVTPFGNKAPVAVRCAPATPPGTFEAHYAGGGGLSPGTATPYSSMVPPTSRGVLAIHVAGASPSCGPAAGILEQPGPIRRRRG